MNLDGITTIKINKSGPQADAYTQMSNNNRNFDFWSWENFWKRQPNLINKFVMSNDSLFHIAINNQSQRGTKKKEALDWQDERKKNDNSDIFQQMKWGLFEILKGNMVLTITVIKQQSITSVVGSYLETYSMVY